MLRRVFIPGLLLAVVLAALPGCTRWEGGAAQFVKNRVRDGLCIGDLGVTITNTPQFSFYGAFFSAAAVGYGDVDGTFFGVGGGDIGAMRIWYNHYGLGAWGREQVGWGDGVLWNFGGFDRSDARTLDCQGVGFLGFFTPPYDARPNGRPT